MLNKLLYGVRSFLFRAFLGLLRIGVISSSIAPIRPLHSILNQGAHPLARIYSALL
jgi:hypothetical protein